MAEEEKRNNLLSSLLPPSSIHGIKHRAESNDTDGGTIRQGQNWRAAMDVQEAVTPQSEGAVACRINQKSQHSLSASCFCSKQKQLDETAQLINPTKCSSSCKNGNEISFILETAHCTPASPLTQSRSFCRSWRPQRSRQGSRGELPLETWMQHSY